MNRASPMGNGVIVAAAALAASNVAAQAPSGASGRPASVPPIQVDAAAPPQPSPSQDANGLDAEAPTVAEPAARGDIVVTGSRLALGFSTPTPVTAVSADQLAATAPNNIAEAVSNLPAFANSANANRTTGGSPAGTAGQSILNLRSLGTQRNLILLDGQRVIASNAAGGVDINRLPQSLIRNMEVVTGGASAAYGSDAVSGVVNFILDTRFTGVRAAVQNGVSTYGDTPSVLVSEDDQVSVARLLEELRRISDDLEVPTPASLGISAARWEALVPVMAQQAIASGSPANNPRVPTVDEIAEIYRGIFTDPGGAATSV